jgi:hypothetical protein
MTRLDDLRLTSQELTYLASGARLLAQQARADAERQGSVSVREIFERAERVYVELADKCGRLAELARDAGCHRCSADAAPPMCAPSAWASVTGRGWRYTAWQTTPVAGYGIERYLSRHYGVGNEKTTDCTAYQTPDIWSHCRVREPVIGAGIVHHDCG